MNRIPQEVREALNIPYPDQVILCEFGQGAAANRKGDHVSLCQYRPSDERFDAWVAGWYAEEGPAYVVAR